MLGPLPKGPKWLRAWSQEVVSEIATTTPLTGNNTRISRTPAGTQIHALVSAVVASLATYSWRIYPGVVSGQTGVWLNSTNGATNDGSMPSLADGTSYCLGAINGSVAYPVSPFLQCAASGWLYLHITLNSNGMINNSGGSGGTGIDLLFATSRPAGIDTASPPAYCNVILGGLIYTAGATGQPGSLAFSSSYAPNGFSQFSICDGVPAVF